MDLYPYPPQLPAPFDALLSRTAMLAASGAPRSRALVTPASSSCFAPAGMIVDSKSGGYVLSQCG